MSCSDIMSFLKKTASFLVSRSPPTDQIHQNRLVISDRGFFTGPHAWFKSLIGVERNLVKDALDKAATTKCAHTSNSPEQKQRPLTAWIGARLCSALPRAEQRIISIRTSVSN